MAEQRESKLVGDTFGLHPCGLVMAVASNVVVLSSTKIGAPASSEST
jgi:hypothetical protein